MTLNSISPDPFDPRFIDFSEPEYRIYAPSLEMWAVVDYVDYVWAIDWLWSIKRNTLQRRTPMYYCYRQSTLRIEGVRFNSSLYLHIEIMKRTGIEPPTPAHTLVDHIDNDTLNCCRYNLRWATREMNRANRRKDALQNGKR